MKTQQDINKELVIRAFDTLFNKRDYAAAEKLWSPNYIQHSAHIPPGRDGLFNLVKSAPPELRYENHVVAVNGDYVLLHGRFTGNGRPRPAEPPRWLSPPPPHTAETDNVAAGPGAPG